jgi:phosphatidate phosphatase APP1
LVIIKQISKLPGVSSLYRGIFATSKNNAGSVHYVSGSTSTLYSRIQNFLKLHNFPQGSLSLKNIGSNVIPTPSDTYNYKLSRIRPIMNAYPNKKFIMFGDTTQKDADVYLKIKQEFPQNVIGIYINNATKANPNDPKYNGTLVTNSAIDAAQDLLKKGVITQDVLDKVTSDVK